MDDHHDLPTSHSGRLSSDELSSLFVDRGDFGKLQQLGGVRELARKLNVDIKKGLINDAHENQWRKDTYGTNVFPERKYKTLFQLFVDALKDTTLIILCIAAVISLAVGIAAPNEKEGETRSTGWIEGASILIAVLLVSSVNAINNWQKDKQFRILEKEKNNDNCFVIRDGEVIQIRVYDVLVGDIVSLQRGDKIPADGILFDGKEVRVDQAALTGESFPVQKGFEKDPFMLSGCVMADGDARFVVCCVGTNSEWGKVILELDEAEDEQTPLQEALEILAKRIGWFGTAAAVIVFIVLTIWWVVIHFVMKTEKWELKALEDFSGYFMTAVTIVVLAVPEGLPLAVTISLAFSMKKMMKDNNLVRHLDACETMGGVTNICTDKTGTLTENRMTVVKGWVAGSRELFSTLNEQVHQLVTEGIAVNSKANIKTNGMNWEFLGNKTECALLVYCKKQNVSEYNTIREANEVVKQYNFSSERKRMSTVIKVQNSKTTRLHCKGASEVILEHCTNVLHDDGSVGPIDEQLKSTVMSEIKTYAQQGLRTIALAYRDIEGSVDFNLPDELESNMTFIAVFGIEDPLRPEVRDAVQQCKKAGIVVRMVTGDNIETARKIASECGILEEGQKAMEGSEFRKLADSDVKSLKKLRVLARSTPQDKKLLVQRLKELGEVVAVTGDGTNDAIAMSEAHVGLAMGIEGTGVAKQASDIIILDDNFASIVKSVMWGRNVRDNIQKFLQFQLTVNGVALALAVIAAVTGKGTPLKAIQLLWVNLIMDTLAALALGTEPPTMDLLSRPPVGKNYPLISAIMWRNIIGQAIYQLAVLFVILYAGHHLVEYEIGSRTHYTFIFNAFVFCQVFNEIHCRKVQKGEWNVFKGLLSNYIFLGVMVVIVGGQILIVEFGGDAMKTVGLSLKMWLYSVIIGAGSLIWGFILKLVPAPEILCCRIKVSSLEEENAPLISIKK